MLSEIVPPSSPFNIPPGCWMTAASHERQQKIGLCVSTVAFSGWPKSVSLHCWINGPGQEG